MADNVVLVTGSSGLIGRALCHRLGSSGYQVIGFDREGPPYPPPKTDCIFVDQSSDESMQNGCHISEERFGRKLKAVIHLAAYYSFERKESALYDKVTCQGTDRLLHELERFDVDQFIFSSTMLVHSPTRAGAKLKETDPLKATWGYPRSKIQTEKLIAQKHGTFPATILRIAGVYTDLCQSIPIAHQIQRIYEKRLTSHFYPGSLETRQSYIHLDDLIDCILITMERRDSLGPLSTFLIGEPDAMTYGELQDDIGMYLHGVHWGTWFIPPALAKVGVLAQELLPGEKPFIKPWMVDRADDNYDLDISMATKGLGWAPKHSLRQTLPHILHGLQVDPVRWYQINKLHMPEWLKKRPPHARAGGIPQH